MEEGERASFPKCLQLYYGVLICPAKVCRKNKLKEWMYDRHWKTTSLHPIELS